MADNKFEINNWFNDQPIRVLGTNLEPYFYASELGTILGIGNIRDYVSDYDETEIVTPEIRKNNNVITYRKYKDVYRKDPSMVLLTEIGMYKLILGSKSEYTKLLKKHIIKVIRKSRLAEQTVLNIVNEFNDLKVQHKTAMRALSDYQAFIPAVIVFVRPINGVLKDYICKNDLDIDIAENKYTGELYLFTANPTADDYTIWTIHAKIFGNKDNIFNELSTIEEDNYIPSPQIANRLYINNFDTINFISTCDDHIKIVTSDELN
jgi:prophage antirepressor-like protein